jgi:hypothetical protein
MGLLNNDKKLVDFDAINSRYFTFITKVSVVTVELRG